MGRAIMSLGVAGMLTQQDRMAVIGNNIANSRTTGFKGNKLQFSEEFISRYGQALNGINNQFGNGVRTTGVTADWGSGPVESTSNMANVAITGDGFFPVAYQGEIHYCRAGDFSLVKKTIDHDNDGGATTPDIDAYVLMRPNGAILLGATSAGGAVTATQYVNFDAPPTSYEINASGVVSALGANVNNGFIGLQRFNNPDSLAHIEGGLYRTTSLTDKTTTDPVQPGTSGSGQLIQGALENSNVDLVGEFTEMIQTQRAFQANSKTINTADEMLQVVLGLKR